MSTEFRQVRSYTIRNARMSEAQRTAYRTLSERWTIPSEGIPFDWEVHFPGTERRIIEIGFGMGDATRQVAGEHPDWGILGIEVHRPGIGKLLWWIDRLALGNLKIVEGDAVKILESLIPKNSTDAIHVWFPDPWPKKKHHKRRLVTGDFVELAAGILKPGGYLHFATDWEPYALEVLDLLSGSGGMKNRYESWAPRPDYRPLTKFEARGIDENRIIRDLIFEKYSC